MSDTQTLGLVGAIAVLLVWCYEIWHAATFPRHESKTAYGTARWATKQDLLRSGLFQATGLVIGRFGKTLLRTTTDKHLLTLAPTRSGKGVSAIIPNLLTYQGSVFVIDPKGENAAITARQREALGQAVHVLDPWGITPIPTSALNPLDWLDPNGEDIAEDAAMLADALVFHQGDGPDDSHWDTEAKALLTGLVLHVATMERAEQRNLCRVRELLTAAPDDFDALMEAMAQNREAHGLVARAANRMMQKSERELSGVISSAQAHTHFLDSPRMAKVLSHSDFQLSALKLRPKSLFLVLPPERLSTFNRWLRLMVGMSLTAMARIPGKPRRPVLFLLDEFASLGHLDIIETAMGLMAGYGVQLWPILQDLSQLKALYGQRWQTFVANAGVVQAFNVNDPMTAEHLSSVLGKRTVTVQSQSAGRSGGQHRPSDPNFSVNYSQTGRPLMMPDEILRMQPEQQLLLIQGQAPSMVQKIRYYEDAEFKGLFDANPMRSAVVKRPRTKAG